MSVVETDILFINTDVVGMIVVSALPLIQVSVNNSNLYFNIQVSPNENLNIYYRDRSMEFIQWNQNGNTMEELKWNYI